MCTEHAWYFFPEEKPQDSGKMANAAFGLMRKVSSGNFFKAAPEPATKAETTDPIQAQEEKSSSSTPQLTKKSSMSQLFSDAQQVWELKQHFSVLSLVDYIFPRGKINHPSPTTKLILSLSLRGFLGG